MKNMKLITETWNRFVNEEEEAGGQVPQIPVPSAWVVVNGPVPGIQGRSAEGATLLVYKVEGNEAHYGVFYPNQPIKDPKSGKDYVNMYSAVVDNGVPVADLVQAYGGARGESFKMPVAALIDQTKMLKKGMVDRFQG